MQFETANISGFTRTEDTGLHLHLYGSGPFMQRPWRANDWVRTNFLALVTFGVHLGYLIAAIRVLRHLRTEIRAAASVRFTGHSLGGAVAEVAAVVASLYRKRVSFESYGGPAPWWWVTAWGGRLLCWARGTHGTWYIAGGDFVPLIPFWNCHLGSRERLPTKGDPITDHIKGYDGLI